MDVSGCGVACDDPKRGFRGILPVHRKNPYSVDLLPMAVQTSHILRRYVGKPPTFVVGSLIPCQKPVSLRPAKSLTEGPLDYDQDSCDVLQDVIVGAPMVGLSCARRLTSALSLRAVVNVAAMMGTVKIAASSGWVRPTIMTTMNWTTPCGKFGRIPNRVCSRSGLLSLLYPRTTLAGKGDSVSLMRSRD